MAPPFSAMRATEVGVGVSVPPNVVFGPSLQSQVGSPQSMVQKHLCNREGGMQ